jgi:hypothetical protein
MIIVTQREPATEAGHWRFNCISRCFDIQSG